MKNNKIKLPTGTKSVFRSLKAYEENVKSGKELKTHEMDAHYNNLSKFFNKNGTLSKRALRSNKAKKEFAEAVKKFKESDEFYIGKRKKQVKEYKNIKNSGLKNNPYLTSEAAALKADKIFRDTEAGALFSGYNYYELVLDIADNAEISASEIKRIFDNIYKMRELEAPDDSMEALKTDEANELLKKIAEMDIEGLNADELMDLIWELIRADEGK